MTERERNAIAGRFHKVAGHGSCIIVGLLGSLRAEDLNAAQLEHIKGFYQMSGGSHALLTDYRAAVNASMYNDYLLISKEAQHD